MKTGSIEQAWKGTARCAECGIRTLVLFGDLGEEDFSLIHLPIDEIELAEGGQLYATGASGAAIYTLRQGLVKLVQFLPDGGQRIVRLATPGTTFALEVLVGARHAHTAIVMRDAKLCRIPKTVVERLQATTPRIHHRLMQRWQSALEQADGWLTELSTGKAPQRLARLLLRIVEEGDETSLFTREEIGAMLGITTEHASRVVSEFRRNGILRETGANRFRCDRARLECIAAAGC